MGSLRFLLPHTDAGNLTRSVIKKAADRAGYSVRPPAVSGGMLCADVDSTIDPDPVMRDMMVSIRYVEGYEYPDPI